MFLNLGDALGTGILNMHTFDKLYGSIANIMQARLYVSDYTLNLALMISAQSMAKRLDEYILFKRRKNNIFDSSIFLNFPIQKYVIPNKTSKNIHV